VAASRDRWLLDAMTPERWQQVKEALAAVLEVPVSGRAACLEKVAAGDDSLRHEVEILLNQQDQMNSQFMDETSLAEAAAAVFTTDGSSTAGRRVGTYKILERIGVGGMGEVYRAVRADGQYAKEVAVKLVRGGFDSRSVNERFRNERQILASLDHPNIARLLDGGTADDGMPYIVMELIEGEQIDRYCYRNRLTVADRLRLFRQVCSAVQYAHRRLVIHRDIKPSNILVTKDGSPKLLDFGIAKILTPVNDAETAITVTQAMTPEYASPEQLRGAAITTATDVYSLGVVLYQLLTGRSPYRGHTRAPHELAQAVCETEPLRPSAAVLKTESNNSRDSASADQDFADHIGENTPLKLQRRLAGDLDNIVLMALRKEPERRYPAAERLADDLSRHMEGLPVTASPGSWTYRAVKFAGRNKVGMAASLAVLVALTVGVMLTAREARIARQQAEIAEKNRKRAEKRFDDVRKLSDSLIFDVHDAIQNLPGSTPARKLLLDRALEYLDSVSQDAAGETDLERELAKGYQKLAVVQGSAVESNLGEVEASIKSDRKALALFENVAKANPNHAQDQLNVAMMHRVLSFSALNDITGQKELEQAIAITDHVLQMAPNDPVALSESAIQQQDIAFMLDAAGDRSRAIDAYRRNYEIKLGLWQRDPKFKGHLHGMGISLVMLGEALAVMGSREEGSKSIAEGIGYYETLVKEVNGINERRELIISQQKGADILLMNGDAAGALAIYQKAQSALEAMAKPDPENAMLRIDLANMNYYQGRALTVLGRNVEANGSLQRAIADFEKTRDAAVASDEYPRGPAAIYIWMGDLSLRQSNLPLAMRHFQHSIAMFGTKKDGTLDDDERCIMGTAFVRIGEVYLRLGNPQQASASFQKALDTMNPPVAMQHKDVPALYVISEAQAGKGEAARVEARSAQNPEERSRLTNEARIACQSSLETWGQIPNPSSVSSSLFLSNGPPHGPQNLAASSR
jgi:serine/threonine protein kinase/tetratricopeptide (TPR) repeat protein